ncbi:MAG: hypothetical protein ABI432_07645 [Flavobacteriales bacterium]
MNTNWAKILLFSLISFALGFAICCMCCHHGCGGGGCERGGGMGMAGGSCMHGDGGSCMHGGGGGCTHGEEGKMSCCKGGHGHGEGHDDHGVHAIVMGLKDANFQGDTTIAIDGGTVNVHRDGEKMEVKVEMRDSTGKTVTEEVEVTH